MQIEFSNQALRAIPATCPKELRARIEAEREQRNSPPVEKAKTNDGEEWELLKKFSSLGDGEQGATNE
jgi:hypothetical protein